MHRKFNFACTLDIKCIKLMGAGKRAGGCSLARMVKNKLNFSLSLIIKSFLPLLCLSAFLSVSVCMQILLSFSISFVGLVLHNSLRPFLIR